MPSFRQIVAWVARRPARVLAGVALLAIAAGALAALTLRPTAATDTLVGKGSASWQATQRYHQNFGDDAVYVLIRGQLTKLVMTSDIERVLALEGCLSGNAPKGVKLRGGANGPCGQMARTKPVQVVYGPGTFINESVRQIQDELSAQSSASQAQANQAAVAAQTLALKQGKTKAQARKLAGEAKQLVAAQFERNVIQIALKYGLTGVPQLNDPQFVNRLVFDASKKPGTPKARFAYLFPNAHSALIQVRLKPGLSDAQRLAAITLVRRAVAMPDWHLNNGESYVVTGAPVVLDALTGSISHSMIVLLIAALVVMAGVLALVFRARLRLLPLVVAVMAAALTFGVLALVGAPLTMATIGVLPVLVGLAVDYAIQFQSRVVEQEALGEAAPLERAAEIGLPTIATAAAASAAGFLVVALSPVPMVREFGLLLVVGIALALGCAMTAGTAVLALAARRPPRTTGLGASLGAASRGAEELLLTNRAALAVRRAAGRAARGSLDLALAHPRRVLAVAAALAVIGWVAGTQTGVETDVQKLVPASLPALRDLNALERSTGVGGEVDVTVSGANVATPQVVSWMTSYQQRLLKRFGYSTKQPCGQATLCPAFSLPDLFAGGSGQAPSAQTIDQLLAAVPAYFSQGVIARDHRMATLAFGIKLMPLSRQEDVLTAMRDELDPPKGVHAELAGLPVLAADANAKVSSGWRRAFTLIASLLAVALVLLATLRTARRALVPLVPIALATGWSALVLFLVGIPLNPMSVTLGALVVAISTEFSVLLSERFRSERLAGASERDALLRTYRSTGAAVFASGLTAIAGFAVLTASDIRMLRSFGWVTVVDLTVALAGVLVVLPSVLVMVERGLLTVPTVRAGGLRRRLRPRRAPVA